MNINDFAKSNSVRPPIDFARVNAEAMINLPAILRRWLPDGKIKRGEFIALNPRRNDTRPGSFSINIRNGVWKDFSSGDGGSDPVSLAAYLSGLSQYDAAVELANMLGIDPTGSTNGTKFRAA